MSSFLFRYRRHSPRILLISKELRPRLVNSTLLQKRYTFLY